MSYGFEDGDPHYPPDWMCMLCGHVNFAKRPLCEQCQSSRSAEAPPAYAPTHAAVRAGAVRPTIAPAFAGYGYKGAPHPPPLPMPYMGMPVYPQEMYDGGMRVPPPVMMPGDWYCPNPRCGHLNFAKRMECQLCKTPREHAGPRAYAYLGPGPGPQYPPDWKCLQCDNINFARRQECKQCNAPRTANSPPTHVSQQYQPDWRCSRCSNINFSRRTECKQCGAERTPDAEPAYAPNHAALKAAQQARSSRGSSPGPGDWHCPQCGFMNFARRTQCLQCKTEKIPLMHEPLPMPGFADPYAPYVPY